MPAGKWKARQAPRRRFGGSLTAVALALSLATFLIPGAVPAKESMSRATRIDLIRGLVKEIGVTKVALPRGKKGIRVSSQGTLDKVKANAELRMNGVAVTPGMPVEITKITFKSDAIVFEINHGGKKGKKWYQRIEVGVGTTTRPVVTDTNPSIVNGSWITLTFPGKVPDVSLQQVKQALGAVLDFERHSPTVLYNPSVPPQIKEAIKNHQVIVGMDRDAVLSAKGPPDRKVREAREGVEQEDWIYGLPPHVLFVKFDGDSVTEVKQY
jgi:hypothetical protein